MLARSTAALLTALTLTGCAATSTASPQPQLAPVRNEASTSFPTPPPTRQPNTMVGSPKLAPAILDCPSYVPLISKATGVKAEPLLGTPDLCRYRLPYARGTTNVSILFRAEPPGTPSYVRTEDHFGNTAYQVIGPDPTACGLAIALDPYLAPHEHGSHLTVLGSFETAPCATVRKIIDPLFARLTDAPE
ncbi:hypothetical protein [Actinokineospora cianjurensis]|uniref:DUF3558 domain-containing protein n=1 Tax=Actinokineospora cianjurensis TaxID=585224 RepID=A0A421AXW7_9PSEU|nr:hypothetical protein [Actinokineospora cianjurensis]RLK54695.1 hypothetical protein CLV68_5729 [Actinokineospora cianjurensis]